MSKLTGLGYYIFVTVLAATLTYFHIEIKSFVESVTHQSFDVHGFILSLNVTMMLVIPVIYGLYYFAYITARQSPNHLAMMHPFDYWRLFGIDTYLHPPVPRHREHRVKETKIVYKRRRNCHLKRGE
jgi:hypothetical protein